MKSGWYDNKHFNIFDALECQLYSGKYQIDKYLPGYNLTGLLGWDDFILEKDNKLYTVPTVPLDQKYLKEFKGFDLEIKLEMDNNINEKIKWYLQPIVFGGNPSDKENMIWIDLPKHIEYVNFWNNIYFTKQYPN